MRTARSSSRPGGLHQAPPAGAGIPPPGAGTPREQAPPQEQTPPDQTPHCEQNDKQV